MCTNISVLLIFFYIWWTLFIIIWVQFCVQMPGTCKLVERKTLSASAPELAHNLSLEWTPRVPENRPWIEFNRFIGSSIDTWDVTGHDVWKFWFLKDSIHSRPWVLRKRKVKEKFVCNWTPRVCVIIDKWTMDNGTALDIV